MLKDIEYFSVEYGSYFVQADVSEEVAAAIDDFERKERNYRCNCRRHNLCSLEALPESGDPKNIDIFAAVYGQFYQAKLDLAFKKLTNSQQRRLRMRSEGMTFEEIARAEQVSIPSVYESVDAARKKLKKFLSKNFQQLS